MSITITAAARDALWEEAMAQPSAIGEVYLLASRDEVAHVLALRARQHDAMGQLDDPGWAHCDERREVALTMAPGRPSSALPAVAAAKTALAGDDLQRDDAVLVARQQLTAVTCARRLGALAGASRAAGSTGGAS